MPPRRFQLPSDQDATGRSLGSEELRALTQVVESGVLTCTRGTWVRDLEGAFAEWLGTSHAIAVTSGTAALHVAIAALDPEPGDEVVTTPVTDMGALSPILYQGAIPVFADVDPQTGNVSADTLEARISPRTRALVVTHLFGHPCEMGAIADLAARHGLPLIEDCAQAYGTRWQGRRAGTFGSIACFSLQQGKHVTTGEGGLVATSDAALARRMRVFVNKAWPYGEPNPDHEFLALNYRMNELTGAVALAQIGKLDHVVSRRIEAARRLAKKIADVAGIDMPGIAAPDVHGFWRVPLRVDSRLLAGGPRAMAEALGGLHIASAPRYIQKPAFACRVFQERRTFGSSTWPFSEAREEALDWSPERFRGTLDFLEHVLVLPWNERYEDADVDAVADAVRLAASNLAEVS
jgi:perosamine synthetase